MTKFLLSALFILTLSLFLPDTHAQGGSGSLAGAARARQSAASLKAKRERLRELRDQIEQYSTQGMVSRGHLWQAGELERELEGDASNSEDEGWE